MTPALDRLLAEYRDAIVRRMEAHADLVEVRSKNHLQQDVQMYIERSQLKEARESAALLALKAYVHSVAELALNRIGLLESGVEAMPRRCKHTACKCTACQLYEVLDETRLQEKP